LFRVTLRRLDLVAEIYHLREPQKIPQVISLDPDSGSIGRIALSEVMGHVWTAPAVQGESDLSAKRSGAAMYPACFFAWRLAPSRCSRYGRWP
jgi:hypothetical protein